MTGRRRRRSCGQLSLQRHPALDSMTGICEVLDRGDPARPYATALAAQTAKLGEVRLTPSARLLTELRSTGESFVELALRMSSLHKAYFLDLHTPNPQRLAELSAEAEQSLQAQQQIEAADRISFEAYLARYFAQTPVEPPAG